MSCKLQDGRPDWKAYTLGEMDAGARQEAENHISVCSGCQDELAGLRVTLDAMATLRDEELPRRIAFVSDKVFEPRWYQKMGQTFLRPSFAAACVIAAAILVHAFVRPVVVPSNAIAQVDTSAIEARITRDLTARLQSEMATTVNTAVTKAVAETEKRDDQRTALLLAATDKRYSDAADFLNKQVTRIYALNTGAGVR
jgi:hypothetical protein